MSNRQSGAVGLPNALVWAWYFWQKDVKEGYYMKDPNYYARQQFQKLIYRLNQPFLRIDQTAFTNISIFDRCYLESLFGGVEFEDGLYAIDHIEDLVEFQKMFMEVVSDIREENMFTFPVLTYSLYYKDGKFQDEEFAHWASTHNIKWSDSNFFVSDNIGVLSNCPMSGDTKILYWSEHYKQFYSSTISGVYGNLQKTERETIKVMSNGELVECKVNQFKEVPNYEIELVNGVKLQTTAGHLNKVLGRNDYVKTREYVAICEGIFKNKKGEIKTNLLKNENNLMYSTNKKNIGQTAITNYEVLKENDKFSLVKVLIYTGRKNQIRVHMKELGHGVVGDEKYNIKANPIGRLGLHAKTLSFIHPFKKTLMTFSTLVPKEFKKLFK